MGANVVNPQIYAVEKLRALRAAVKNHLPCYLLVGLVLTALGLLAVGPNLASPVPTLSEAPPTIYGSSKPDWSSPTATTGRAVLRRLGDSRPPCTSHHSTLLNVILDLAFVNPLRWASRSALGPPTSPRRSPPSAPACIT